MPLKHWLCEMGAYHWRMLARKNSGKLDWSQLDTIYSTSDRNVIDDYKQIHTQMLYNLIGGLSIILRERQKNNRPLDINIIDAGCGKAPQLLIGAYRLIKKLSERYQVPITIKGLGFDFEKANSDWCNEASLSEPECKQSVDNNAPITFLQGNMLHLEFIVKQGGKRAKQSVNQLAQHPDSLTHDAKPQLSCTANTYTILLSSGSFTRMTLGSAFEALDVLKGCWRAHVDQLVLGGEIEVLFVKRMLKRIGYTIKQHAIDQDYEHNPVFTLERVSTHAMVDKIKRKVISSSHLDLSMSPCTQQVLDKVSHLTDHVTSIDLSFSMVDDAKIMLDSLKKMPSLTKIIYHCNNTALLCDLLLYTPNTLQLDIRLTNNEFTLAHSKNILQRTGYHSSLLEDPKNYLFISEIANQLHRSNLPRLMIATIFNDLLRAFTHEKMLRIFTDSFIKAQSSQDLIVQKELSRLMITLFPSTCGSFSAAEQKLMCITDFNERLKIAILMAQELQGKFHHKNIPYGEVTLDNVIYDTQTGILTFRDLDPHPDSVYVAQNLFGTQRLSLKTDVYALGQAFKNLLKLSTTDSNPEAQTKINELVEMMTTTDASQRPAIQDVLSDLLYISCIAGSSVNFDSSVDDGPS